jgi:hypothetical protein
MEQQLYGSSSRSRDEDSRVILGKWPSNTGVYPSSSHRHSYDGGGGGGGADGGRRQPRRSESDSRPSRSDSRNSASGGAGGAPEGRGLRGLIFNILRSRFDLGASANGDAAGDASSAAPAAAADPGSPTAAELIASQLVQREGSMHLPRPAECQVAGTHSDMCIVRVRRNHLVEDALDEISRQYRCASAGGAVVVVGVVGGVWCVCVFGGGCFVAASAACVYMACGACSAVAP